MTRCFPIERLAQRTTAVRADFNHPTNYPTDGTSVERKTWANGKQGSKVVLIEIEGMGHTWPGKTSRARQLGATTKNVLANDLMGRRHIPVLRACQR